MEKSKDGETKTMTRLFRLEDEKEKTWVEYNTRTCTVAREIWVQMGLPFCVGKLQKVCGLPWDGSAMENLMLWLPRSKKFASGEVRDGGTHHRQK